MSSFSKIRNDDDVVVVQRKLVVLGILCTLFVLIVISRLFYLQIYRGRSYQVLSDQITSRDEEIRARRGLILDRNGKVLADNRPFFQIVVIPQNLKNPNSTFQALHSITGLAPLDMADRLLRAKGEPPFLPVVIADDASYEWVAKIREYDRPDELADLDDPLAENPLKGVEIRSSNLRIYRYPEEFSHALGYLREIDQKTLDDLDQKDPGHYSRGDLMGASGLEIAYDSELKGIDGVKSRIVDARGKEIKGNSDIQILADRGSYAPTDGHHLVTTLDFEAQDAAAIAMEGKKGAVVALDPKSGEVLVLFSNPGFDGNRIMKNIDHDYWKLLNTDKDKYLYNRATQATYPPGSTYKIVDSFAGLDTGKINLESHFTCGGGLRFGNRFFQCWNKGGHGSIELIRAITQSCDVFFYNVGLKVGVDELYRHAHLLGLGEKTGIDIPSEQTGLIPSAEWKLKRFKQPWIESETLSIAIGQGYDTVTPLQNARMIATIANGGHPLVPHLAKEILSIDRKVLHTYSKPLGESVVSPENLKWIQEGLIGVVHGVGGTAGRLKNDPHKIAGKTGTAQVVGYESKIANSGGNRDHAWFVAYAPYDDPKIALAVVVENGGHGGAAAAPVAQAVIDAYLEEK